MNDDTVTTPPREVIQAKLEEAIFDVIRSYDSTPEAARRVARALFRICGRMIHKANGSPEDMIALAIYGYESEQAPSQEEAAEWTKPTAQA